MKVKAAVLREVTKGYSVEELELEPPRAGEALVKYTYTGYCHSDLSNMMGRTSAWRCRWWPATSAQG